MNDLIETVNIGWERFNDAGLPVQSKSHVMVDGSNKTLCGQFIPTDCDTSSDYGTDCCKKCKNAERKLKGE